MSVVSHFEINLFSHSTEGKPFGKEKGGSRKAGKNFAAPLFLPYGLSPQTPFPLSPLFPPASFFPRIIHAFHEKNRHAYVCPAYFSNR